MIHDHLEAASEAGGDSPELAKPRFGFTRNLEMVIPTGLEMATAFDNFELRQCNAPVSG